MGSAIPAAVAASIAYPGRQVLCFVGDGGFMMSAQELATSFQYKSKLTTLIFNNGILGSIRQHQEMHFPRRVISSELINPDFAALCRSMGCFSATVGDFRGFESAIGEALDYSGPSVINIIIDPDSISTTDTLSRIAERSKSAPS
jgi:acetolactate synthase-1/2/3 large subunit